MVIRAGSRYRGVDRRRTLTVVAVIVAAVYLFFTGLSTVWTDFLWFRSVDFTQVWQVHILTSIALGAIGGVFVFGVVWLNLWIVDRVSPRYDLLELGADEELVERFREWVEPRLRLVRVGISAAFALLIGVGIAAWRDDVLLFMNPTSFGVADPQFDTDLSFFVFRLPLWSNILSWVFNITALTLVLIVAIHYLNGGIRISQSRGLSIRQGTKAHISVMVAVLAVIRAVTYRLDAFELVYTRQVNFSGAGFTEVNARLPALQLLALVSLLAAALFVWNIWRKDWTLAFVSIGAWVFVSLAAGLVYPAVIQRLQVDTRPLDAQRPYIERHLTSTRAAYGLDLVEVRPFEASTQLEAADISANRDTIDNLRLWDPGVLRRTYQQLQEIRTYYRVDRVDTDRYVIGDKPTQVMIAVRELEEGAQAIPGDWQNQRLIYTHGFGAVVSPANAVEGDGQPDFVLRDVPPVTTDENISLTIDGSRVYFGESYIPGKPVVVKSGTRPQEVDFPLESVISTNEYEGAAGVPIDSIVRKLAFALRYRDLNLLISSQLRDDSRILMTRNIRERVNDIAPFLATDSDPYPVIVEGRIVWVIDMYTVSDRYPYSQPVAREETLRLPQSSGLPRSGFNYVRNSVKATVDALDGTVTFYAIDDEDPILASWRRIHPALFQDGSTMPVGLVEHLRYPQDLFKVQSDMYLLYHIEGVEEFFSRSDAWSIPADPSTPLRTGIDVLWGDEQTGPTSWNFLDRYLPNYLLLRLPGEEDLSYTLIQPFTPLNKPNMSSFLVADSTPGRYGRLINYRLPSGSLVEGTGQVGQRINQDPDISEQITLWSQEGSDVLFGDMLVTPIKDSILYVMPVYLAAEGDGGLPEFRRVVAVFDDRIEWADTLDGALRLVFEGEVGEVEPGDDVPPPSTGDGAVDDLLRQAAEAFDRANAALREGDLSEYQRLIEDARRLVDEALSRLEPSVRSRLTFG